ncbi:MAG: phosphodiesterase [Hyphomicrobiaceae bacterium]|nr:phosphodiesterase [Hyphomicrobiaceae bacterium]
MKILQVTDVHFVPAGETLHGLDPRARLDACIADINAHHQDAAMCFITGDLAHAGQVGAYENLKDCLSRLKVPYVVMVGNHDSRKDLLSVFPDTAVDENGFVQTVVDLEVGRCILLDTVLPNAGKGENWGEFCERRAAWLEARLEEARGRPIFLFLHHPPFDISLPSLDNIRLRDTGPLTRVLSKASGIRHMFLAHVHRPVSGSWRGIPFSIFRGTNHQVPFDLDTISPVPKSHEPPAYGVIFLTPESVVIHAHDYLDRSALPLPDTARKIGNAKS